jgi:hypothetical protein
MASRHLKSASRTSSFQNDKPSAILKGLTPHRIHVPKRADVTNYVAKYKQLGKLLPEVCAQLRQAFGPQAELSLELYRDPEIDDPYLTLYVREAKYGPEIMQKIDAVSREFNGKLEQVSGYLLLTTDFHRPTGNNVF